MFILNEEIQMTDINIKDRMKKNVEAVRALIANIEYVVDLFEEEDQPTLSDLGDISELRRNLYRLLGQKDVIPE